MQHMRVINNFIKEEFKIMKVVLLAGGFGTRISEESHLKPKPNDRNRW